MIWETIRNFGQAHWQGSSPPLSEMQKSTQSHKQTEMEETRKYVPNEKDKSPENNLNETEMSYLPRRMGWVGGYGCVVCVDILEGIMLRKMS